MAFGGKYLRSIALNAWEHATQATGKNVKIVSRIKNEVVIVVFSFNEQFFLLNIETKIEIKVR